MEGAKVAALIAVNAMIETVSMCIPFMHEYTFIEFWEEVKIEIEKL
jgi:molybdenum cofactor biosynthesis enzyme